MEQHGAGKAPDLPNTEGQMVGTCQTVPPSQALHLYAGNTDLTSLSLFLPRSIDRSVCLSVCIYFCPSVSFTVTLFAICVSSFSLSPFLNALVPLLNVCTVVMIQSNFYSTVLICLPFYLESWKSLSLPFSVSEQDVISHISYPDYFY